MKLIIQIFLIFFSVNFASTQSMVDLNEPLAIKKANVKKCTEVYDGEDFCIMYYDTAGYQTKYSVRSFIIGSNSTEVKGFFGVTVFLYDTLGNKIEKQVYDDYAYNKIPSLRNLYTYNELNQLIVEESKREHSDAITEYYYRDSLLIKYVFKSSYQTFVKQYYYDESNQLCGFEAKDSNKKESEYTNVYYRGDTTFHQQIDSTGKEVYLYYRIVDQNNRLKEVSIWDKPRYEHYKINWFYNERDLLDRKETYSYRTEQTSYHYFKYE